MLWSYTGYGEMTITGYRFNASNSVDVIMISFYNTAGGTIPTGTYSITPSGSSYATIIYMPNIVPGDTTAGGYMLLTGVGATLTTATATNAIGTFGGTGFFVGTIPDYTKTITISNGTFNVPVIKLSATTNQLAESFAKRARKLMQR
jgi:hypothetical protein